MAGHTRVYWDPYLERLVPILPGVSSEAYFYGYLRKEILEFCATTWSWGLDLIKASPQSRILLLLDDAHAFRSEVRALLPKDRKSEDAPRGELLTPYRERLFEAGVPKWYLDEIAARGLTVGQVLLDNHDLFRPPQAILPRECWLHSEHHLNGKGPRRELGDWAAEQAGAKSEVSLIISCLVTDPEDCRCLETAGSLLFQISKRFRRTVLFVPTSCADKVRAAADQLFRLGAFDAILCVSGIGDMQLGVEPRLTVWESE